MIKDAKELPGLFRVWQKDDKTWLELAPDQFDTPYVLSISLSRGLGEKSFFGGLMWDDHVVLFRKVGTHGAADREEPALLRASTGTPEARAVEEAFADSLLAVGADRFAAASRTASPC